MGWEDEGSLPGMDEKRALLAQKHASADIRKQQEKERKTKQRNVQKQKILDNRKRNNNNKQQERETQKEKQAQQKATSKELKLPYSSRTNDDDDDDGTLPTMESLLKKIERLRYQKESIETAWKRSEHENENLQMGIRRLKSQVNGAQENYDTDIGKLRKRVSMMQDRVTVVNRLEKGKIFFRIKLFILSST